LAIAAADDFNVSAKKRKLDFVGSELRLLPSSKGTTIHLTLNLPQRFKCDRHGKLTFNFTDAKEHSALAMANVEGGFNVGSFSKNSRKPLKLMFNTSSEEKSN
jgi:hypothetical protein